jgi:hypothetical protein
VLGGVGVMPQDLVHWACTVPHAAIDNPTPARKPAKCLGLLRRIMGFSRNEHRGGE